MDRKEKLSIKYLKRPLAYRIDKNDEKIYAKTLCRVAIIIYLIILGITIYEKYESIEVLKKEILTISLLALLVTIPLLALLYIIFNKKLEYIRNIQKLAELILASSYYIKSQIMLRETSIEIELLEKTNSNRTEYNNLYFPKFYIKQPHNEIKIYIRLDGSKFQNDFLNLETKLEYTYNLVLKDKKIIDEYIIYTLSEYSEENRLMFSDINKQEHSLKLMNNVVWEFRKAPHGLIVGSTGTGKTYLIFYVIKEILKKDYKLKIIDPKISDLAKLGTVAKNKLVVYKTEEIKDVIDEFLMEMNKRYYEMLETQGNFGKDYVAYGFKPYFLMFDELLAYISLLDRKEEKEMISKLIALVVKGRQAGVFLIFATQRPDTDVIDGKIREQLGLRIALGNLSSEAYRMVFGNSTTAYRHSEIKGSGYYQIKGIDERPKNFISPYIEDTEKVYKEIVELIKEKGC